MSIYSERLCRKILNELIKLVDFDGFITFVLKVLSKSESEHALSVKDSAKSVLEENTVYWKKKKGLSYEQMDFLEEVGIDLDAMLGYDNDDQNDGRKKGIMGIFGKKKK